MRGRGHVASAQLLVLRHCGFGIGIDFSGAGFSGFFKACRISNDDKIWTQFSSRVIYLSVPKMSLT